MLSIGGASYRDQGFSSKILAQAEAEQLWAMFGPKVNASVPRPFGDAVLDGFDFDLESPVSHIGTVAMRLRNLMNSSNRTFYLSAAPQCPFPDRNNEDIISQVALDWLNVQFYNNPCGSSSYDHRTTDQADFNFKDWDAWARTRVPVPKVLLGLLASTSAGSGYITPADMQQVVGYSRNFTSFGGVMVWDASQAWLNPEFTSGLKTFLA
jgi:chitinase